MLKQRGTLVCMARDDEGPIEIVDHEGVRAMYFGTRACQSSMLLAEPSRLTLGYTRSMLAALLFRPEPRSILLIGLGGGSLARFLLQHVPEARVTGIEARERVLELARDYFQLPDDPRLQIHIADGADFLSACADGSYDLILIDAFDSVGVHPSVRTREFYQAAHHALAPGGVVSVNLWTTPGASYEQLLRNMAEGFAGQILRLPVEQRANLIAFALDRSHTRQELRRLDERACKLEERCGLEFRKQLRSLQRHNGTLMRRLLDLRLR